MLPSDVISELSYAYLHAVAAACGVSCKIGSRHDDNAGVDAELRVDDRPGLAEDSLYTSFLVDVQLKATTNAALDASGAHYPLLLERRQYDKYRNPRNRNQSILVMLLVPKDTAQLVKVTAEELSLRKAAYWVSLRGAPAVKTGSRTVHVPQSQMLTPAALKGLLVEVSRGNFFTYPMAAR